MEVLAADAPGAPPLDGRPLPELDAVSRTFWNAAARGELLFQECDACGHRQFYPRAMCTACAATPGWTQASGRGTVHTFTIVRQNHAPPFDRLLPYVVAMVELEEGPRMMGNVTHCEPDEVRVGMAVEAYAVVVEDGVALPFWRPAGGG